jgi:hypothetical protein
VSDASYEREIRSLSVALNAECRNSLRLAGTVEELRAAALTLIGLVEASADSLGPEWLAFAEAMERLRRVTVNRTPSWTDRPRALSGRSGSSEAKGTDNASSSDSCGSGAVHADRPENALAPEPENSQPRPEIGA